MARRQIKPATAFKKRRNVGKPVPSTSKPMPSPSPRPRPDLSDVNSASKKKLGDLVTKNDVYRNEESVNMIADLGLLSSALCKSLKCSSCDSSDFEIKNSFNIGPASKLELYCNNCSSCLSFMSSPKIGLPSTNMYEVNARLVYGLRSIGKGVTAAKTLCGIMNLPSPPKKCIPCTDQLGSCAEDVCFESMRNAVEETVVLNENL